MPLHRSHLQADGSTFPPVTPDPPPPPGWVDPLESAELLGEPDSGDSATTDGS